MAKADAEHRLLAYKLPDRVDGVTYRFGVTGAIGKENPIGLQGQNLVRRGSARQDGNSAADLHQAPGYVPFHPVIEGHNVMRSRASRQQFTAKRTVETLP